MMSDFAFQPIQPRQWHGRYRRPAGNESAYHVNTQDVIRVFWRDSGYDYTCPVRETPDVRDMARDVNAIKLEKTGLPGGSFVINEFGKVICPVRNSHDRFLLGEASGSLCFENPWNDNGLLSLWNDNGLLSLCNDEGLNCGDRWQLPYMGIKYQLHENNKIYFWFVVADGARMHFPRCQDFDLIGKIRQIRPPGGGISFIVNQHGIVLTKKQVGPNQWQAVYVGRINYDRWF